MSDAQKKQNFLQGTALLAMATAIVKVIGAFYKIPLNAIIGEKGFGYFNTAYEIYNVLLMISTAGLPQSDKDTNIIWSKSSYVSLSSLYDVLLSSNKTPENIIQEIKKFEDLIYYRPVLGNGEGYLEFDLYFSYRISKEICSRERYINPF